MKKIKGFSSSLLFLAIVSLILLKIVFFIFVKADFIDFGLGGGNDSDYYHSYAIGYDDFAVNIWPVILRYLNDIGLYSREVVSYFFLFLNLFVIPIMVCKLANIRVKIDQRYYFYLFLICSVYPSLFFYTFDVYRDVFMVFSFLIACFAVKSFLDSSNILISSFYFIISIVLGVLLLYLRPYLGYAFLISIFLCKLVLTKRRVLLFSFLYLCALFLANYLGALDSITRYRSIFEEMEGGSNLGIDFSNPIMFIPNFILSLLGQMFGLYITNPLAIVLLVIETIPFIIMLFFIINNVKLADKFVRFLIIFFVLYASVWLIGNDNLGTAVRLRIYNYLAVYICFFYILRRKNLSTKNIGF